MCGSRIRCMRLRIAKERVRGRRIRAAARRRAIVPCGRRLRRRSVCGRRTSTRTIGSSIERRRRRVVVRFGLPEGDGEARPGTPELQGRAMVAQVGPMEFLVTGFDASVSFRLADPAGGKAQEQQVEILRAEEGQYANGAWVSSRIWN